MNASYCETAVREVQQNLGAARVVEYRSRTDRGRSLTEEIRVGIVENDGNKV